MKTLLPSLIVVAVLAMGCATESDDAPTLFAGMSRDRLKTRFGEPIRVEQTPTGGEDWYYPFSKPADPQADIQRDGQNQTVSVSLDVSRNGGGTEERPVHLSRDGFVIEPLPKGHLVR